MLAFFIILIVIFVAISILPSGTYTVDPFACGTDGMCICDKAKDCKKVESKKEK